MGEVLCSSILFIVVGGGGVMMGKFYLVVCGVKNDDLG